MASHSPDWGFSECPRHPGRGVMSTCFRWVKSGTGQGWQRLRKCNELGEFKLHKLHGLNGLHRLHGVDGGREGQRLHGLAGFGRGSRTRLSAGNTGCGRQLRGLHKLPYFNRLCGRGIRITDGVCGAGVVGTVARCLRHGAAASPHGKPPKATTRPYTRHILGIDSGVQSHHKGGASSFL